MRNRRKFSVTSIVSKGGNKVSLEWWRSRRIQLGLQVLLLLAAPKPPQIEPSSIHGFIQKPPSFPHSACSSASLQRPFSPVPLEASLVLRTDLPLESFLHFLFFRSSPEPLARTTFVQKTASPSSGETMIRQCCKSGMSPRGHTQNC